MRFLLLLIALGVVSCDFFFKPNEEFRYSTDDEVSNWDVYEQVKKTEKTEKVVSLKDVIPRRTAADPEEQKRIQALTAELSAVEVAIVNHSLPTVAGDERMVSALQKAAQIVDDIYKLQVHRNNLIWQKQLESSGEKVELEIFRRYAGPWCRESSSKYCNAIATKPPKKLGGVFWPLGMTHSEFNQISNLINSRELLSPFGLVVRDGDTRLKVVSYLDDVRFGPLFVALANVFTEAASNSSGGQKSLLSHLAQTVQEPDLYTLGANGEGGIASVADWRVYFGAFDASLDPFRVKRSLELTVARPYVPLAEQLTWYKKNRSEIIKAYWNLFGETTEPSFEQMAPSVLEVVDIWITAGRARYGPDNGLRTFSASAGVAKSELSPRVVFFVNRFSKQLELLNLFLRQLLPRHVVGLDAVLTNQVAKEIIATVIPGSPTMVTNEEGQRISIQRLLGKKTQTILRMVTGTGVMWLLQYEKERGNATEETLQDRVAAMLAEWLKGTVSVTEAERDASRWMVLKMLERNALKFDTAADVFLLDSDKFLGVAKMLFFKLNNILLRGDLKGAKILFHEIGAASGVDIADGRSTEAGVESSLEFVLNTCSNVKPGKKVMLQYQISAD